MGANSGSLNSHDQGESVVSNIRRWLLSALGLTLLSVAPSFAQEFAKTKPVKCLPAIASCGCTITSSGIYIVTGALFSAQGVTASDDCLDIQAANVKLFLQGNSISGPGSAPAPGSTGAGIHLLKSARGAFVEGTGGGFETTSTVISGWGDGLKVEGSSGILEDFICESNIGRGVILSGARNNNISNFGSNNNLIGIDLQGSSMNQVNFAFLNSNQIDGLHVDGNNAGKGPSSKGNFFYNLSISSNGLGVEVFNGSTGNLLTDITASGNNTLDFFDENPCGQNLWTLNSFATASPGCLH